MRFNFHQNNLNRRYCIGLVSQLLISLILSIASSIWTIIHARRMAHAAISFVENLLRFTIMLRWSSWQHNWMKCKSWKTHIWCRSASMLRCRLDNLCEMDLMFAYTHSGAHALRRYNLKNKSSLEIFSVPFTIYMSTKQPQILIP